LFILSTKCCKGNQINDDSIEKIAQAREIRNGLEDLGVY
jgi:hypothetical protein